MSKIWIAAVVGAFAVTQIGCGSDEESGTGGSGAPDFVALEGKLTQPTGTLAPGQESSVQDAFGAQTEAASGNPFGGGGASSGTSTTQSADALSTLALGPLNTSSSCSGFQQGGSGTCSCPNGGSITYDIPATTQGKPGENPNGTIDQTVSIIANQCGTSADQTVHGSIYWKLKNPPPMQLFSVHVAITGRSAGKYDVEYLYKDGVITFAVDVADGRVLVSAKGGWNKATKTGTLTIKDKNETWTCSLTNGKGTCTSDKGASRNVG